ncbi:uncharacterized protein UTRI_10424_B [Ustilago trichophora]|uniref:Effector family protein Eff1 n=1 Tax=Ustilago trichophora TaxID=86804 RepID=A0A5C3EAA6_9BASI|nr:uncharacterized protein UTRI_10424_B [Ustilago trichophora]
MVAINRSVLVALSITLALLPLVFSMDPQPSDLDLDPTDLDNEMHEMAKEYYFDGHRGRRPLVPAGATWFPNEDLAHYQQKVGKNLAELLHRHAIGSEGVMELIPYASSPLHSELSEYSTPHSSQGSELGDRRTLGGRRTLSLSQGSELGDRRALSPPQGSELGDLRTLSTPPSSEWAEAHNQWIHDDIFGIRRYPTYYISIVPPEGRLGKLMNLEPKLAKVLHRSNALDRSKVLHQTLEPVRDVKTTSPAKQALALWRYENGQVNLVAIDTWSASVPVHAPVPAPASALHHASRPRLQKLKDLIPVENIDRIVTNALPWHDLPEARRLHI